MQALYNRLFQIHLMSRYAEWWAANTMEDFDGCNLTQSQKELAGEIANAHGLFRTAEGTLLFPAKDDFDAHVNFCLLIAESLAA